MFKNSRTQLQRTVTIRQCLWLITLAKVVGCALIGWLASDTLMTAAVGGKFYRKVSEAKDLVADVLPPPAYIIETHLLVHDACLDDQELDFDRVAVEFKKLRREYETRLTYWNNALPEGALRSEFCQASSAPAEKYFAIAEELISRLQRGVSSPEEEWRLHRDELHRLYSEHRHAIETVVAVAEEQARTSERAASDLSIRRSREMVVLGLTLLVVTAGLSISVGNHVARRLDQTSSLLKKIAEGDLSQRMSIVGNDEIDRMGVSLNQAIARSAENLRQANESAATSARFLQELREREVVLKSVLNSAPDSILTVNSQLKVVELNPAAERMFQISRNEALGCSIESLGIQVSNSVWTEMLELGADCKARTRRFESAVLTRVGDIVPVSAAVSSGQSLGDPIFTLNLQDISGQIETKRQIESLARFPDESPGPVARITNEGVVLYANGPATECLKEWHVEVGCLVSDECQRHISVSAANGRPESIEHEFGDRVFSMLLAPVPESQYVNLFATDVTERKRAELDRQELNDRLISTARQAGMAEIATGVLHNVGNVLNSVNVATTLLVHATEKSRSGRVGDVAKLLREHESNLGEFFRSDARAARLPGYLTKLAEQLHAENTSMQSELEGLSRHVDHIRTIVATQQAVASISGLIQPCQFEELIDEAIEFQRSSIEKLGIRVQRDVARLPELLIDKQKVMQILVNFIKNAREAIRDSGNEERCIEVTLWQTGEECVSVSVRDSGIGIPAEIVDRIFSHGFTTKKDGHGFGLHCCANFASEMGGRIRIASEGPGRGATFTLELPFKPAAVLVG